MLSQFFSSSYKQHKDDTSAFTTWLERAAEACGYRAKPKKKLSEFASQAPKHLPENIPPPHSEGQTPSQRLKGKARKAAKQAQVDAAIPELVSLDSESLPSVKYAVSTQELEEQIEAIAHAKGRITMPLSIQRLLR